MKRVFHFKKDDINDGDNEMYQFLEDYLVYADKENWPHNKKNWKVTIIIEDRGKEG